MGLRAGYQYLNDENLTKLKACSGDEEVFDYLEAICADSDDDFADMLDIDKMWDVCTSHSPRRMTACRNMLNRLAKP